MNQRLSFVVPTHHAAEEPQCQALHLHLRSLATADAPASPALCVPPAVARWFMCVSGAASENWPTKGRLPHCAVGSTEAHA
jgi:hypothetical protein